MMAEPLTEEARDILAKFSAEDINRIIAQIDNKGLQEQIRLLHVRLVHGHDSSRAKSRSHDGPQIHVQRDVRRGL